MAAKIDLKKCLSEVSPDHCFWVHNGPILKNLEDLANFLPHMSDETFNHHVNKEKNDFSKWVNDVIGEKKLASELLKCTNKNSAIKKLRNRLNSLKKRAG